MYSSRHIFTDLTSATSSHPGPMTDGRPPVAVKNKAKRVVLQMIAYAAVMVRDNYFYDFFTDFV